MSEQQPQSAPSKPRRRRTRKASEAEQLTLTPTAKILEVTPDEYHALPGLSSSIATTLIAKSPLHAWTQHPCFGGKGKAPTKSMDRGSVVHTLALGVGKRFHVLDFGDYKTKAAQVSRDMARDLGMVPILRHEFDEAETTAAKVREQLAARGIELSGASEVAIEWTEPSEHGPVACRGMLDHLIIDRGLIIDLKIVSSADQESIERSAENYGYAIQAAAYRRAVTALRPALAGRIDVLFAFCEAEPPYAINPCTPDGMFRELGERRWLRAVHTWGRCLKANEWPAYGAGINTISPPAWALAKEGFRA